jgi:hypothetical protein
MTPLPDRTVILGMLATLGLVFALIFWFVRLAPSTEAPLQWRESAPLQRPAPQPPARPGENRGTLI